MSGPWIPPFCANEDASLKCPKCGEHSVCVREQDYYLEGHTYEAFCGECTTMLEVTAVVEISFEDVVLPD